MIKIIEYETETGEIVAVHIVPPDAEVEARAGIAQLKIAPTVSHVGARVAGGRLVEA